MTETRFVRLVWALIVLSALVRVWLILKLWEPAPQWTGDARVYFLIADGLRGGRFIPEAWVWPPGYPLFGVLLSIFGGLATGLHLVTFLAGTLLPGLVFAAGRTMAGPLVAGVAALVLALSPIVLVASLLPLADILAVALVVAAVVLSERAYRRNRFGGVIAAGAFVGLATLTRPEAILTAAALPLFWLGRGRRGRQMIVWFSAVLLLTVAPYVVGMRVTTGCWGITMKAHYNLAKTDAYRGQSSYGDARVAWGASLQSFRDENGVLVPQRIATEASPWRALVTVEGVTRWRDNLVQGMSKISRLDLAWGLIGILGLVLPGRGRRRGKLLAVGTALPFLSVPLFLVPVGRFLLPLLPAIAWGTGLALGSINELMSRRREPVLHWVTVTIVLVACLYGAHTSIRQAFHAQSSQRFAEVETAIAESRWDVAERLLLPFLEDSPTDPFFLETYGMLLEGRGDESAAERVYRQAVSHGGSPLRLANLLARSGRIEDAEKMIAPLRDSPPENVNYWMLVGSLAMEGGRWDEAADSFLHAQTLGGPAQVLAFNLGVALANGGHVDAAIRALQEAESGASGEISRQAHALRKACEDSRRNQRGP